MIEDQTYGTAFRYDDRMPSDYVSGMERRAKEQAVIALVDKLDQPGNPIYTVKLMSETERVYGGPFAQYEYRVRLELSQVERRHVVIATASFPEMGWAQLSTSALGEIKHRIKRTAGELWDAARRVMAR